MAVSQGEGDRDRLRVVPGRDPIRLSEHFEEQLVGAKAGDEVKGKTEMEAVIAYLQVMGIHRK